MVDYDITGVLGGWPYVERDATKAQLGGGDGGMLALGLLWQWSGLCSSKGL